MPTESRPPGRKGYLHDPRLKRICELDVIVLDEFAEVGFAAHVLVDGRSIAETSDCS